MSYIYHMKPDPFEGTSLVPLNQMDVDSELYKRNIQKYKGREDLMSGVIPKLKCKWNDVVQFSALDPQIIIESLRKIRGDFEMVRKDYFKVHLGQILGRYEAVVFDRTLKQKKGLFQINDEEVEHLDRSYAEKSIVPRETTRYWESVKENGGVYLMFPYVPHILVKGTIDITEFEVCSIK